MIRLVGKKAQHIEKFYDIGHGDYFFVKFEKLNKKTSIRKKNPK